MSYRQALFYAGTRDPGLEALLTSVCVPALHRELESFLACVAACEGNKLLIVAAADAKQLPTLIAATRAAARWGGVGLHHHLVAVSRRAGPGEVVAAFRSGCDGFIPLPCTTRQMLRGLPEACRERHRGALAQCG